MFGANSILDIGRTALSAAQAAISVTGENIANVSTEGYSRRTVRLAEGYNINSSVGQIGTGVQVAAIQRNFDQYVESQYYSQATQRDRWDALYTQLQGTESLFNESQGYGLSSSLSTFFDNWENLTQRPEDSGSRSQVIESAQTLVSTLRQADADLSQMQLKTDTAITQEVSNTNDIMKQIADLNTQIKIHSASDSNNANQLMDQRSQLVRDLAQIVDINYIDKGNGNVTITTEAGQTLVDNEQYFSLSYEAPQATAALKSDSKFDGNVYFSGSDNLEYTLEITSNAATNFTVSNAAAAATFRVSVDGGKTWLKNSDGSDQQFYARPEDNMVQVGNIQIWFGSGKDSSVTPDTTFTKGDRFTIVPKKAVYWNENTSTKEIISPATSLSGVDNPSRLSGGSLAGLCNFKDDYVGKYRETLDATAESLIWEINRRHSQGVGLQKLTDVQGTYSVANDNRALASASSGLDYGSKLTAGSANLYIYNASTGLLISGAALDFSDAAGQQNFDPATTTIGDVSAAVNRTFGNYLTASVINHKLTISTKPGVDCNFAFGTDSSGLVAALGLNTFLDGSSCSDIEVNSKIITDQDNLCTGHVNGAGEANQGDATTATSISDLRDTKIDITTVRGGTVSQSVVKYQHAYTAAAKLITTADQMLQTLLGMKS